MDKNEFLDRLRTALIGTLPPQLVNENISYYDEYITSQMRMGRTQEEVIAQLGDPRLLAKTILTANDAAQDGPVESYREDYDTYGEQSADKPYVKVKRIPAWLWIVLVILIIVVLLSIFISVLSFLLPILLPVLCILFFVKLFRDWLH